MEDLTRKPESLTEAIEILDRASFMRRNTMASRVRIEMESLRDLSWTDAQEEIQLLAEKAHRKILMESQVQPRRLVGLAAIAGFGLGYLFSTLLS